MRAHETDAWAHAPSADKQRRWLLGAECTKKLRVRHLAQHFMFRCALRIRAELAGKSRREIDVRLSRALQCRSALRFMLQSLPALCTKFPGWHER